VDDNAGKSITGNIKTAVKERLGSAKTLFHEEY
jgi:hypothetical protein